MSADRYVELYSLDDMERHSADAVDRALRSDRKIAKYNRSIQRWKGFEWNYAFLTMGIVIAMLLCFLLITRPWQEPQVRPETTFEKISDTCFSYEGKKFCAEIVEQYQ